MWLAVNDEEVPTSGPDAGFRLAPGELMTLPTGAHKIGINQWVGATLEVWAAAEHGHGEVSWWAPRSH